MIKTTAAMIFAAIVLLRTTYSSASTKAQQERVDEYFDNIRLAAGTQEWANCGGPSFDTIGTSISPNLIDSIVCLARTKPDLAHDLISGVEYRLLTIDSSRLSTDQLGTLINLEILVRAADEKVRFLDQRVIAPTIVDYNTSPVTLKSCVEQHKLDDPQWVITASWRAGSEIVTAIKLHVETENAFGDVLQSDDLTPTGSFSSDADSQDEWVIGDAHMPPYSNVAKVRCSITSAILADGSLWKAPTATPSPVASKKPQARHPAISHSSNR